MPRTTPSYVCAEDGGFETAPANLETVAKVLRTIATFVISKGPTPPWGMAAHAPVFPFPDLGKSIDRDRLDVRFHQLKAITKGMRVIGHFKMRQPECWLR